MDSVHNKSTKGPTFSLEKVKALVAEDRFQLGARPGCIQHLEAQLHGEVGRYSDFVRAVFEALRPEDFHDSKRWPEPDGTLADEYGIALPGEILDSFEVSLQNWYVKFHIAVDRRAEQVLLMSLHPLAYDIATRAGVLKAGR